MIRTPLEQDLVNMFIDGMRRNARADGVPIRFVQIESGATAIGIPDLLMFFAGQMYWIECKRGKVCNSTERFTGSIKFRPGQLHFLRSLLAHNEKAFILVLSPESDCCVVPVGDIPLSCEGGYSIMNMPAIPYPDTYDYIKGLLNG